MSESVDGAGILRRLAKLFPQLPAIPAGVHVVGGAVRDVLLRRIPVDLDLAGEDAAGAAESFARTNGARAIELGRDRFKTWRVVVHARVYDFNAIVGESMAIDLERRDFSANAIAIRTGDGAVLDPFGGAADIQERRLRMIRESNFHDDPLRLLKGIRLATTLRFAIDDETLAAIRRHADALRTVAPERVSTELQAALRGDARRAVALLRETGLDAVIFDRPIDAETANVLAAQAGDPVVAFWVLLDAGSVDAFAARWRWSEELRRDVHALAGAVEAIRAAGDDEGILGVALHDAGPRTAKRAIAALQLAGGGKLAVRLQVLVQSRGDAIFQATPLLTGHEIASAAGLHRGPAIGAIKRALLERQIRGEIATRDEAEAFVRSAALPE